MALCTSGQPTIEWQYTGEDKQRIIGADDYSTRLVLNNPHSYWWWWSITVKWRYIFAPQGDSNEFLFRTYTTHDMRFGSFNVGIQAGYPLLDRLDEFNQDPNSDRLIIPYEVKNAQEQLNLVPYNLYVARSYRPVSWVINFLCTTTFSGGGCTVPQPNKNCVFKVLKNNLTVYQKSAPTCPTVTYFCGEQCPPGTCQCDCGSEVCCYDTVTGKAVKSFKK